MLVEIILFAREVFPYTVITRCKFVIGTVAEKHSFPRDFRRFVGIIIGGNNFAEVSKCRCFEPHFAFYKVFKIYDTRLYICVKSNAAGPAY